MFLDSHPSKILSLDDVRMLLMANLDKQLKRLLPNHPIKEVYHYAVFPPGKLFRPLLVYLLNKDLSLGMAQLPEKSFLDPWSSVSKWASFIELHHAYTLVHDDLPCMDNDPIRRNKPSTHIQFGQWQALLVGDGLLSASYHLLSSIKSHLTPLLFQMATWALGPKGLIQGQVLDLSHEMRESFSLLLETHKYKTARLMQLSLVGAYLLSTPKKEEIYRTSIDLWKLGLHIGNCFQLLDDLQDLGFKIISPHESEINPFIHFPVEATKKLEFSEKTLYESLKKYHLLNLESYLKDHLNKMKIDLKKNWNLIIKQAPKLAPMESFLNQLH